MVKAEQVKPILEKWQGILRLKDWDINIEIVKQPWRKSGDIKIHTDTKMAVLMINEKPTCYNIEEVVVHELLHLKLYDLDQLTEELIIKLFGDDPNDPKVDFAYTRFFGILEPTVQDLTKAFLDLSGNKQGLSFGYLEKMVAAELEKNRK